MFYIILDEAYHPGRGKTDARQARELVWFLDELQTILQSVRAALDDIADLLNPAASSPACTLVMSSLRSEAVKGYITRVGTRIVKGVRTHFGNLHLHLHVDRR